MTISFELELTPEQEALALLIGPETIRETLLAQNSDVSRILCDAAYECCESRTELFKPCGEVIDRWLNVLEG